MATISYLTKIQFDFGAIKLLPEELAGLGVRRPLMVTDPGIAACGLLDRVRAVLPAELPVAVFDGTPENPTESAVREALAVYREARCDGVVGLGGGSSLDLAKAVRLLVNHPGPLAQYAFIEGGLALIRPDLPPLVAVADLNRRLGIPAGLRQMGVQDDWLPALARQAVADHCNATNPRPADAEAHLALFREAMA